MDIVFISNLMRFGSWSELRVNRVCQEHELMTEADTNDTYGELGFAFGGTLVRVSQLSTIFRAAD